MTGPRTRAAIVFFVLILFGVFVRAPKAGPRAQTEQQTETQPATSQPWDAGTRYPDWEAPSNLTVTNDCKKGHTFSITAENADFLDLKGVKEITVPGKKSVQIPVRFHTDGMAPGDYTGQVTVLCLDCKEIPPCVQDRKLLSPHIVVIAKPESAAPAPAPAAPTTLEETPQTPTAPPDCNTPAHNCDELQHEMQAKLADWEKAEAAYTSARNNALDLDEDADDDCEDAQQKSDFLADANDVGVYLGTDEQYQSILDEVDEAWSKCLQADDDWQAAEAKADEAAVASILARAAYHAAEDAYQKCVEAARNACPRRPFSLPDEPLGPWQPWPEEPTTSSAAPTGGTPKKSNTPVFPPLVLPKPKVETPTTQMKPPCPVNADDCESLRRIWKQKDAAAASAQADADAALAYAKSVGKAAGDAAMAALGDKAGTSVQASAAAMAIAAGAQANADNLQKLADQAKAAAAAAKQAYDNCAKALAECTRKQRAAATGGPPHTKVKGCAPFPESCDGYKAQYDFLNNAAAAAQARADRAKAQQDLNNKQADGLQKDAKTAQDFASWQTSRALDWRNMAGEMAAIAARDLEIRNQYPAGSASWNSWNEASQSDLKESQARTAYANQLEATELKYDMEATRLSTEAAQLRSATSDAQAIADKAKAAATEMLYIWKACEAREQEYYEKCAKKGAAGGTP
jgi:hypothetical protein